jgi:hypothetical protein
LFGPLIDGVERLSPGMGFSGLFFVAALAFGASILPIKKFLWKEVKDVRERNENKRKIRSDAAGLAVLSLPADPAALKKDQNP